MGKETKIGLAILGVLVVIFAVLLVRHFRVPESAGQWDESGPPAVPLATAKPDEPSVVMAQKESRRGALESLWEAAPRTAAPSETELPAGSYLPDQGEPTVNDETDDIPAAPPDIPVGEAAGESSQPAGLSPFQSRESLDGAASMPDRPAARVSAAAPANPFSLPSAAAPRDARLGDEPPTESDSEPTSDADLAAEQPADAPAKLPPPLEAPRPLGDADRRQPREARPAESSVPSDAEPQSSVPAAGRRLRSALVPSRVVPATATEPVPPGSEVEVYVVREGDTLFDIARAKLGKAARWVEIYELNRELLSSPDLLPIGAELTIPNRSAAPPLDREGRTTGRAVHHAAYGSLTPVRPIPSTTNVAPRAQLSRPLPVE